jgi:hypothetical protein
MDNNNEIKTVKSEQDPNVLNFISDAPDNFLSAGQSEGYSWCVMFNRNGFRCGYVGIPQGHPWYEKSYGDIPCECHGGLTFAQIKDVTWWIGFDCGHAGDAPDPNLSKSYYDLGWVRATDVIRSQDYVEQECISICMQAKAAEIIALQPQLNTHTSLHSSEDSLLEDSFLSDIKTQLPEGHTVIRKFKILNHQWELDGYGCVVIDEHGCPYFATTNHGKFWKEDIDYFTKKIHEYTDVIDDTYDAMLCYERALINHIKAQHNAS